MREIKFRAWDYDEPRGYKMNGYQYKKASYHPNANSRGYVLEHKLVLENWLGKYLPKNAIVHHKNAKRDDNRIDNLEYMEEQSRHAKHHDSGKRNPNGQFVAESQEFRSKKFRLLNKNTGLMQIMTLQKLMSTTFRNSQFEYRGEFTGLKDKNEKEIYEGDIVIGHYAGSSAGPYRNKVVWNEHEAAFGFANAPMWTWESFEVIGNIYENPDLLKSK